MSAALHHRLDEVALNAWPALQQVLLDGWVLRASRGYSKRANSVQALYGSTFDPEQKIAACEAWYETKRQPCIFRLTPFSAPAELDRLLERRGYALVEPSRVMDLDLRLASAPSSSAELREEALDPWLQVYGRLSGSSAAHAPIRRAILEAIWPERRLFSLRVGGEAAACAMTVREGEYVGLLDVVVAREQRNRGKGAELVRGVLAAARERGAARAYLQVVSANAPACRLYEKLGFRVAYEYWYRVEEVR